VFLSLQPPHHAAVTVAQAGLLAVPRIAASMPFEMRSDMHFHRQGSGQPLVLIHGIGHHWQAWQPVIDLLDDDYDLLAVDSPGFGLSAPLPTGMAPTVWAYADAFEAFFTEQGIDRPHVAGNSMGGAIALELARRGSVRSATALSPAGFWTSRERSYAQTALRALAGLPKPLRPAVRAAVRTGPGKAALLSLLVKRPSGVPTEEAVATLDDAWASPVFSHVLATFSAYDFTSGHELVGIPVTVAWGDKDRLLGYRRQAPRARAALPQARHVTLDAGHLPYTDDPRAVATVIRETACS